MLSCMLRVQQPVKNYSVAYACSPGESRSSKKFFWEKCKNRLFWLTCRRESAALRRDAAACAVLQPVQPRRRGACASGRMRSAAPAIMAMRAVGAPGCGRADLEVNGRGPALRGSRRQLTCVQAECFQWLAAADHARRAAARRQARAHSACYLTPVASCQCACLTWHCQAEPMKLRKCAYAPWAPALSACG